MEEKSTKRCGWCFGGIPEDTPKNYKDKSLCLLCLDMAEGMGLIKKENPGGDAGVIVNGIRVACTAKISSRAPHSYPD